MTILVIGGSGVLGKELVKKIPNVLKPTHKELDITDHQSVFDYFHIHSEIDTVIHTAALTGIRECEIKKELAMNINVTGKKNIEEAIQKNNEKISLIYISTACIFDGHDEM